MPGKSKKIKLLTKNLVRLVTPMLLQKQSQTYHPNNKIFEYKLQEPDVKEKPLLLLLGFNTTLKV